MAAGMWQLEGGSKKVAVRRWQLEGGSWKVVAGS